MSSIGSFKERVLYCDVITTNFNLKSRERVLYCGVLMNLKAMMSLPNYIGYYRLDFEDYISSKM